MDYKKEVENVITELRQSLEHGRSAVIEAVDEEETRKIFLDYIESFDDRFTNLEKLLFKVYARILERDELIAVYNEKLNEAYKQLAASRVDNRSLETSLFTGGSIFNETNNID